MSHEVSDVGCILRGVNKSCEDVSLVSDTSCELRDLSCVGCESLNVCLGVTSKVMGYLGGYGQREVLEWVKAQ